MIKNEPLTPEQRFGSKWDYYMISIMCIGVVSCIAISVLTGAELLKQMKYDRVPALVVLTMCMIFVWERLCMFVNAVVRRYWLLSYVIDESDPNILKLFGSVRSLDLSSAKRHLLSIRSNYQIVQNPYELYGCTMAAVPAGEEYLAAKAELKNIGLDI